MTLCKIWKTYILSIIAELLSIRGILLFLFIMKEPIDEHQGTEMFFQSDWFLKSKNDESDKLQLKTVNEGKKERKKEKKRPQKKIYLARSGIFS